MTAIEALEFEPKKYFLTSEILNNHVTFTNSRFDFKLVKKFVVMQLGSLSSLTAAAPFELSLAGLPVFSIR